MEMGSMGEAKTWLLVAGFVGGGVLHELGFLPLYIFSDFRHPLLGFHKTGFPGASELQMGRILLLESLA